MSAPALGLTQPPIQWVPGALSLGVERLGREADHSPQSRAEVKNSWSYTCIPQYVFKVRFLVKHRQIYFPLLYIFMRQINGREKEIILAEHRALYHREVECDRSGRERCRTGRYYTVNIK
jgi:hypothetical protein